MVGRSPLDNIGAYVAPGGVGTGQEDTMTDEYGVSGGVSLKAGGTAPKVATMLLVAGAGLFGLRMLGFKFNVSAG